MEIYKKNEVKNFYVNEFVTKNYCQFAAALIRIFGSFYLIAPRVRKDKE